MAKFDWDREQREARKRAHGSIPVWADPAAISHSDDREVRRLLEPMVEVVDAFAELSRTQRSQRASEFLYELRKRQDDALTQGGALDNTTSRDVLAMRAGLLIDRLRELGSGQM